MITYNDLYEALRKERYSEQLQPLMKKFISEVAESLKEKEKSIGSGADKFSEDVQKTKKQLENAVSIFKEIMLRRRKKLLELSFVSAETGVSKRDFENMLIFEKDIFDNIMKSLNNGDKEIEKILNGGGDDNLTEDKNKMVIFKGDTEEFLDLNGNKLGPFNKGDLVNIPQEIANILIVDGKADPVDEE